MEETISLQELVGVIKKRISLIMFSIIFGISCAGIVTYFLLTPLYSSQAELIVRLPQNETTNVNDINGNLQMINTYKDLIISDTVMSEVQQRMSSDFGSELSLEELSSSVSVTQSPNSQMFSIVSKSTDPAVAQNIANKTALVFQEKAKDMLNVDKITIISTAILNLNPVSPNVKINLIIGIIVGLMAGIAISFILELFDKTIKEDRFVEEELGLTILGIVPNMTIKELNARVIHFSNNSSIATPIVNTDSLIINKENENEDPAVPTRRNRQRV